MDRPHSTKTSHQQALTQNLQGKRKRDRLRNTWRRNLDKYVKKMDHTWAQLDRLAQYRENWRKLVCGLCPREGGDRKKEKTNIDPHGLKGFHNIPSLFITSFNFLKLLDVLYCRSYIV
jgi:hypothetical protein